ncbi:MAG: formimidoylglutamate deiminase [Myxococcota bacterium]
MLLTAERVLFGAEARASVGIRIGEDGRVAEIGTLSEMGTADETLDGRVLLPGTVNAHSHAFQRLLRGRTQTAGPSSDTFWTWRDIMYRVAGALDPDGVFVASRQAFVEMALAGVTAVGEFHYVHHQPDGTPYDDPEALAEAVIRAAQDVGIRLCLLRTVYLRGDFNAPASSRQHRFCDPSVDVAAERIARLVSRITARGDPRVGWGVAAHSVRALPADAITALKTRYAHVPFHIHVSEQRREVEGCIAAHGMPPIEMLAGLGVLDGLTTLVHATHVGPGEAMLVADTGAAVCVCPSTEADLGDGLVPAEDLHQLGVPLCIGTDGQTLSSVLAEARRLEMHERLRTGRRNVLTSGEGESSAETVLEAATAAGARSIGVDAGLLEVGRWADFMTVDLNDPGMCGWDDRSLAAALVFSADTRAVSDVMVGGAWIVKDGWHPRAEESARAFKDLARRVFA